MGKAQAFLSQRGEELPCLTESIFLKASKAAASFAVLSFHLSALHPYVKKAPFACVNAGRGDFFEVLPQEGED